MRGFIRSKNICVVCFLFAFLSGSIYAEVDESFEPPAQYILQMGNDSIKLVLGEEIPVKLNGGTQVLKLTVASNRLFNHAEVSFEYPHYFTYQTDFSSSVIKTWQMSGHTAVLSFFKSVISVTADDYIPQFKKQFKKAKFYVSECELNLDSEVVKGKKLNVSLLGSRIYLEIYVLDFEDTHLTVIFQNSLLEDGTPNPEGLTLKSVFGKTFKFVKTSKI